MNGRAEAAGGSLAETTSQSEPTPTQSDGFLLPMGTLWQGPLHAALRDRRVASNGLCLFLGGQKVTQDGYKSLLHVGLEKNGSVSHTHVPKAELRDDDTESLIATLAFIEECLKQSHRVVLHCRVGLHRTGLAFYLTLRKMGLSPAEALIELERIRPLMH